MEKSSLLRYVGEPVLVQLKHFPIVAVQVRYKDVLPHAAPSNAHQWIPEPVMVEGQPAGTQLVQFAVLHEVENSNTHIEMRWLASPPDPRNPNDKAKPAVVASLMHMDEIAFVTRVESVTEAPPPSPIVFARS